MSDELFTPTFLLQIQRYLQPTKNYRPKRTLQEYNSYFLVHDNSYVTTLKPWNHLNICIRKTFGEILKKHNDALLFDVLYKIARSHNREDIYSAMKSNVIHYGLKHFHTEYGYLDSEYYYIHMFSQGSTENLNRCLFLSHLIKEGIVRKNASFNLTDIMEMKDC